MRGEHDALTLADEPALFTEALREAQAYWLGKLSPDMPVAALFPDMEPAASGSSPLRASTVRVLDAETTERLARATGGRDALAFVVLVTALKVLLSRATGLEEIVVGTGIHTRHREAADLNRVLVLRDRVNGENTARELLAAVQRTLSDAYAHQTYPFDRLLRQLRSDSPSSRLFAVAVLLDSINDVSHLAAVPCDLTAEWRIRPTEVALTLTYDPARFRAETIEVFARQYATLVAALLERPDARVADLETLTPDERDRLIVDFNATRADVPRACVHRLIEAQAARSLEQVAIAEGTQRISYAGLERRANQLAHYLARRGVGRGAHVAVIFDPGIDAIVAILAVLKAGAAYVPIDPRCPLRRTEYMLAETRAAAIVTDARAAERLPATAVPVVCLDRDAQAIAASSDAPPDIDTQLHDCCYVMYTSGTTGWPKGVSLSHGALMNYLSYAVRTYVDGERADFALHTSLAFDLTVTSIYVPLLTGNRIVAYPPQGRLPAMLDVLRAADVDVLKLTPSHLALLGDPHRRRSRIRRLIVGGETLRLAHVRQIVAAFGEQIEIYNEYGPTEAAVGCLVQRVDPTVDRRPAVPVGHPIANTQIYVVDEQHRAVGEGLLGEIAIAGDSLASGYLHRAALTGDRFVPNPFVPGGTMYLTGDIGRHLPGGGIECLGRRDDQVKVNGVRLQLDEVRAALSRHPDVRGCAVRVLEDERSGARMLAAYYVSVTDLSSAALRAFLAEVLTEDMLPGVFVRLPHLPLTPHGKVDVQALPVPRASDRRHGAAVGARTPTEEVLWEIWSQVLRVSPTDVTDNFFDLGGHSLLATQVQSRIRTLLQVPLPVRALFEAPTIAALAARVDEARLSGPRMELPPIVPVARAGRLPASFAQRRLWLLDQLEPGDTTYNLPFALRVAGPLDLRVLAAALTGIVARHEVLRTTFVSVDGEPFQEIAPVRPVPVPVIDLDVLPHGAAMTLAVRLARREAQSPFNLNTGPLLRLAIVRLGRDDHWLLATMHHIVSDGWSLGLFVQEFAALYEAARQSRTAQLPELGVQYADFALWQRTWLDGAVLSTQLDFWRRQLEGLVPLELPTDRPRLPVGRYKGATHAFRLPRAPVDALRAATRDEGVTPFMTLLTAFLWLLGRYADQADVAVGTPIANRNRLEVERVIGFFVNTLVLRARLTGRETFREALRRVREMTLDAYAHQDLPFERLVETLAPERDLTRTPLFQVMFALQNTEATALSIEGLALSALPAARDTSTFELSLTLTERGDAFDGRLEYAVDLFDAATIERLAAHYAHVLDRVAADVDRPLSECELPTAEERRQLIGPWNETPPLQAPVTALHEFVERCAAATPDVVAAIATGRVLTYGELNRRANRLAYVLREEGVRPDMPVGVCVERSAEMLIALVAVLKAGGAYLPLDVSHPDKRLAYMLEESAAPIAITTGAHVHRLRPIVPVCLSLDDLQARLRAAPDDDLPRVTDPAHLAYVIYTSGSTGRPKGVMIAHDAICHQMAWMQSVFELDTRDRVLQKASIAYDASIQEIFFPLSFGAAVVLADADLGYDVDHLVELTSQECVSYMEIVPSLLRVTLDHPLIGRCRSLRHVTCGGEAVPPELPARYFALLPGQLHNTYGPTETTVQSTWWTFVGDETTRGAPIGRPITNTRVYVTDPDLGLQPVSVAGELCIGGIGLARGYLAHAATTAARFVPDPFSDVPGARLYRTGDRVRWRADGALEFLGRVDRQVKIRGIRIELGEIESVLEQHPHVARAAVMVARSAGDDQLAAYVELDYEAYARSEAAHAASSEAAQLAGWQEVFDAVYGEYDERQQAGFYIKGWDSSYTDGPMPGDEVAAWLDQTVARVAQWQPKRLMELGCGSGLMLHRLAPGCEVYHAADTSAAALRVLARELALAGVRLHDGVRLTHRAADDFTGVPEQFYDGVLVVSVSQYFPHLSYLIAVLEGAVRSVTPGGFVFLGDVRSLPLLQAFHASVELFKQPDDVPLSVLRQRVAERVAREKQLVVAPSFFEAIRQRFPAIARTTALLQRGRVHNELNKFRYDVILHLDDARAMPDVPQVTWHDGMTADDIRALAASAARGVRVRGIPNARVVRDCQLVALLHAPQGLATAGELRRVLTTLSPSAVDPEELWTIGEALGMETSVTCAEDAAADRMDVLFLRGERTAAPPLVRRETIPSSTRWSRYANAPLRPMAMSQVVPQLEIHLREQLPRHLVPAHLMVLDELPLTASGKIDRGALPALDVVRRDDDSAVRVRPRDTIETNLTQIWEEILGQDDIGIRDNFFRLGGHSLTAVALSARLSATYGEKIAVRTIFERPTIEEQAALLRQEVALSPPSPVVAIQPHGSSRPLFLVHPAGGLVHIFVDLARHLGRDQPVYAFQSDGLDDGRPLLTSIEAMAERYIGAMRGLQPQGPYQIGGLSLGGAIAYEMAQQLTAAGEHVALLALLDGGLATAPEEFFAEGWEQALEAWERMYLLAKAEEELGLTRAELSPLDTDQVLARYLDGAKAIDIVPRDVTPPQFRRMLRVYATNVRASDAYRPQPYAGHATLFRTAVPPGVDETFGLGALCRGGLDVHLVPGGHGKFVSEPLVGEFVPLLRDYLQR